MGTELDRVDVGDFESRMQACVRIWLSGMFGMVECDSE